MQAVLVRDDAAKAALKAKLGEAAKSLLIHTVLESKGLEFQVAKFAC